MTSTAPNRRRRTAQSASVATILSFIWPGLGQLYLGRPRAAAGFAVPVALLAFVALLQIGAGIDVFIIRLLAPGTAVTVALVVVAAALWRLTSMTDAFLTSRGHILEPQSHVRRPGPAWRTPRAKRVFVVATLVVILSHGLVIAGALTIGRVGSEIFVGNNEPRSTSGPHSSGGPEIPRETPYVTPEPEGWINTLLVGADSGMGYDHALTDSMIVVSVNQTTEQVAMFSFPRDIARFELYSGGTYAGRLNSLMTYAAANPADFPDGPLGTLSRQLGFLLGVPIHYYAFINLAGFKTLIDEVGGVDVVNARAINDPTYQFPDGSVGFALSAGPHHLDGRIALAFVRSRQGAGDNDFTRARRQQQLILALKAKLTDPSMLARLPGILNVAARTIQTNYPPDRVADLLALSKEIGGDTIEQIVLGPPYAKQPGTSGIYVLVIDTAKFSALSIRIFGDESRYASSTVSSSP